MWKSAKIQIINKKRKKSSFRLFPLFEMTIEVFLHLSHGIDFDRDAGQGFMPSSFLLLQRTVDDYRRYERNVGDYLKFVSFFKFQF